MQPRFLDGLSNYWDTQFVAVLLTFNGNTEADLSPVEMADPQFRRLRKFVELCFESPQRSLDEWFELGFPAYQLMAILAISKARQSQIVAGSVECSFTEDSFTGNFSLMSA
jgi:hypothetical protein